MRLRNLTSILLLAALASAPLAGTVIAETTDETTTAVKTANITLRVAPEGFVVPSHYLVGNDAKWLIDPVNDTSFNGQDGVAGCVLEVAETDDPDTRIDGVEVLNNATDTGCISGWNGVSTDIGILVTSVDGREKVGPTTSGWPGAWWLIQKNGTAAEDGVSEMDLEDGDELGFVYYTGA